MNRFPFIALEGPDGSGKTTFRKILFEQLSRVEMPLSITPYSWLDPFACEVLTRRKYHQLSYSIEDLVTAHIRDKQVTSEELIGPHVQYRPVICDRWVPSMVVYGQVLDKVPREIFIRALSDGRIAVPNLTIYIDTPPELAQQRLSGRSGETRQWWDQPEIQLQIYRAFQYCRSDAALWGHETIWFDNRSILMDAVQRFLGDVLPHALRLIRSKL